MSDNIRLSVRRQRPTPLMTAVQKQNVKAVRSRIDAGDDVAERDSYGQTALHWAAKYESVEIVQLLLEAGANPRAKDEDGDTPLDNAEGKGNGAVAEVLRKAGSSRPASRSPLSARPEPRRLVPGNPPPAIGRPG